MHLKRSLLHTAAMTLIAATLTASSHREAPAISQDPSVDNTDLYAFRSPDMADTVTIIANFNPLEEASNGPNFYRFNDDATYEIHVDNNGDASKDVTYRFTFKTEVRDATTFGYNSGPVTSLNSPQLNERQFYTVTKFEDGKETSLGRYQVAPANIGPKSTPDYAALASAAVFAFPRGEGRVFAGPRDDPFFVDIGGISDLLTLRPLQSLHKVAPVVGGTPGVDNLRGFNVHSIAIQIPISKLTADDSTPTSPTAKRAIIGIYATTHRGGKQVSRLGMPLVNEVVMSRKFKDIFNASEPKGDAALFTANAEFRNRILDPEVAKLMRQLYGINVPVAPRNDLKQVFLTGVPGATMPPGVTPSEMLRLNLGVPVTAPGSVNRLGVIGGDLGGFPNGRRLADDVVDIELRVVAGVLLDEFNLPPNNQLTDGVDTNDRAFMSTFPYLALPNAGFDR